MNEYLYEGPVLQFDEVIDRHYKATTWAISEKKARSNLTYRWKRKWDFRQIQLSDCPEQLRNFEVLYGL